MKSRLALAAAAFAVLAVPVAAQRVINVSRVEIKGKVVRMGGGMMAVNATDGQVWTIAVPNTARVKVTGKAGVDAIAAGMYVRFEAAVDKRQGKTQAPVEHVTIFSLGNDPEHVPGAMPLSAAKNGPPVGGLPGDGVAEAPPRPAPRRAHAKAAPADSPAETYDIRAQVVNRKGLKLTVQVPNEHFKPRLQVELAENAAVDVDYNNFAAVKPGDEVSVRGLSPAVGQARAENVEIQVGEVGGVKKGRRGSAARRAPAAKGAPAVEGTADAEEGVKSRKAPAAKGKPKTRPAPPAADAEDEAAPPEDPKPKPRRPAPRKPPADDDREDAAGEEAPAAEKPGPAFPLPAVRRKKATGAICRNGPQGAAHKWRLSPFSRAS